jgi:hypothetical protein
VPASYYKNQELKEPRENLGALSFALKNQICLKWLVHKQVGTKCYDKRQGCWDLYWLKANRFVQDIADRDGNKYGVANNGQRPARYA